MKPRPPQRNLEMGGGRRGIFTIGRRVDLRLGSAESHPWIHCERLRLSKILILTLVLIVPVILLVPVFLIARPVLSTCNITRLCTWKVIRLLLWGKCWASCNCHTCSLEDVSTLRFKSQLNFAPDLQQLFTSASFSAATG